MDNGYVKVYEQGGGQNSSQSSFGWVDDSGDPAIRFEQSAHVTHEGFTVGSEQGGWKTIGDLTAVLTEYPSGKVPRPGMKVDATDERGEAYTCYVEKWIPDDSFHGVIVMNLEG
jgi:hypothetical protein